MKLTERQILKFWSCVEKGTPNDCWPWLAGKTAQGYGRVGIKQDGERIVFSATHIAIFIETGVLVPKGKNALHSCDNPPCVNPNHLRIGTQRENTADCILRGRHIMPPNVYANLEWIAKKNAAMPKGEANPMAIYTETQVIELCERRKAGETPTAIAHAMNLKFGFISDVTYGRAWQHIAKKYMPFPKLPNHISKSRISPEQLTEMRKMKNQSIDCAEISRQFGFNRSYIWRLLKD